MLVLSGVKSGGAEDGHYVESSDGQTGLWFGNIDDLWSFGVPAGIGGPWFNTDIKQGVPSDAYLMAGYDQKSLRISHTSEHDATFSLQVDFLGTGQWESLGDLKVAAGKTLKYRFENGYSAHWVRLVGDSDTNATAVFTYK